MNGPEQIVELEEEEDSMIDAQDETTVPRQTANP